MDNVYCELSYQKLETGGIGPLRDPIPLVVPTQTSLVLFLLHRVRKARPLLARHAYLHYEAFYECQLLIYYRGDGQHRNGCSSCPSRHL